MTWWTFSTDEGSYGPDHILEIKTSDTRVAALKKAYQMIKYGRGYMVWVTNNPKHVGASWKRYRAPYLVKQPYRSDVVVIRYKGDPVHRLMSDGRIGERYDDWWA